MKDIICYLSDKWNVLLAPHIEREDQFIPKIFSPFKSKCWICTAGHTAIAFLSIGVLAGSNGAIWFWPLVGILFSIFLAVLKKVCPE